MRRPTSRHDPTQRPDRDRRGAGVRALAAACLALAVALGLACWLAPRAAVAASVVITPHDREIDLVPALEIFEDPTGQATIADVARNAAFQAPLPHALSFGFTRSAIWMRVEIARAPDAPANWLLRAGIPTADRVEFYEADGEGGWRHREAGDTVARVGARAGEPRPTIALDLPADRPVRLYLRAAGVSAMILPVDLILPEIQARQRLIDITIDGVFFGALGAIALFMLGVAMALRDRVHAWFAAAVASCAATVAELLGYANMLLWHHLPGMANVSHLIAGSLMIASGVMTVSAYLDLRRHLPPLHRLSVAYATLPAISLLLFALDPHTGMRFHTVIALAVPVVVLLPTLVRLRAGAPEAWPILVGVAAAVTSSLLLQLRNVGAIGAAMFDMKINFAVIAASLTAFAIVIGERFRRLQEQEASLLRAAETRLEREVAARADALGRANRDLMQAAQELARTKSELEAANRVKARFLKRLSEELSPPLMGIVGLAERMGSEPEGAIRDPRYVDFIRYIDESGRYLLGIVTDVLDADSAAAGQTELRPTAVKLDDLISSCMMLVDGAAWRKGVHLAVWLPDRPPPLVADFRAAKQMIINLLANAIKFTPRGGRVVVRCGAGDDGTTRIAIEDTGVGMTPAELTRALEPFGQVERGQVDAPATGASDRQAPSPQIAAAGAGRADASAGDGAPSGPDPVGRGAGLGLPLVRRLIELHGGRLETHSERGLGTTMTLVFPVAPGAMTMTPDPLAAGRA
jgi:two-component system cell cycle sensor histidine kinase PleC